ncbi:MAG: 3-hydroxybutyryl-CoA dehydrogenase, partial [Ardenticatenales bacterium]|nr:3-hydroxybutyryl-CoA dehydrogenase [Ardenticatenales bacterium]
MPCFSRGRTKDEIMELAAIQRIGVLGAGTMGAGIAQVVAQSGYEVLLYDVSDEIVLAAHSRLVALLQRLAERGKITQEEATATAGRI